jgi:xanthine dehydrogenase accessory factor
MDSVDIEVLRSAETWRKAGHRVTLGTIVKTWGSAPRPVGAMVAIRDDGQVAGSVSGGCVEDDLIDKVKSGSIASDKPQLITYGVTNEEATRWGLPCGGTLQVVLEPVTQASAIESLLESIGKQQLVLRKLDMESGKSTFQAGHGHEPSTTAFFCARAGGRADGGGQQRATRRDGEDARLPRSRDDPR